MDRLIIESALSDVNEITVISNQGTSKTDFLIVLGFKASNTDQVIRAFAGLKEVAKVNHVQLTICKTQNTGIYDLEIKTDGLDEPVRIMNKSIDNETLGAIEDRINQDDNMVLTTNVSEQDNWIQVSAAHIKDCEQI